MLPGSAKDKVGGYEHLFATGLGNGQIKCGVLALDRLAGGAIGPEDVIGRAIEANAIEGGIAAQRYEGCNGALDRIDVAPHKTMVGEHLLLRTFQACGKVGKEFKASRAKGVKIVINRLRCSANGEQTRVTLKDLGCSVHHLD